LGCPKGTDHWEDQSKSGRMTLNGPQGDRDRWGELKSADSGYSPMASSCEHGDEPSSSVQKAG
jgi:hypothetical protein